MLNSTELYESDQIDLWKRKKLIHLTWSDVTLAVDNIVNKVLIDDFQPHVIVGISRGGLVPTSLLSHRLGVRNLEIIGAEYYGNGYYPQRVSEKPIIGPITFETQYHSALLVDDIAGSGMTISEVGSRLTAKIRNIRTATLVKNERCPIRIDYVSRIVDDFVVFPWEAYDRKYNKPYVPKTWKREI